MSSKQRILQKKNFQLLTGAGSLLACMAFFAFDVLSEVFEHFIESTPYTGAQIIHLTFETFGVIGLALAARQLWHYISLMRRQRAINEATLRMLRGEFQMVLEARFNTWKLTAAESDVALMIVKGLSIADIASSRKTAQGTIKAQTSSVFRKVGVGSKSELLAVIVEEFLDSDTARPTATH